MAEQVRQLAPHSEEAERAVLAAMLLDREAISKVTEKLTDHSFYFEAHRDIYKAIFTLHEGTKAADIITVSQTLEDKAILDKVGGRKYLQELINIPVSIYNLPYYIDIVQEKELYRSLIDDSYDIYQQGLNEALPVDELIDDAEKRIFELAARRLRTTFEPISTLIQPTFDDIAHHTFEEHHISGMPSGFEKLDDLLGGFQPANLIIIGSRPGGGKTAFALNIALNMGLQQKPVGVFSLEMSSQQLIKRLLSAQSRVSIFDLQRGVIHHERLEEVHRSCKELTNTPIYIDDTFDLTLLELKSKSRLLKAEQDVKMIIVDYLQLLTPASSKDKARYQEIGEMTRALKGLSKELNIPIIALSQLSRETEKLERAPKLSDLRESGSIEQDADVVIFLHTESKKKREEEGEEEDQSIQQGGSTYLTPIHIIVAKQRNGPTGEIRLVFNKQISKFDRLTDTSDEETFP